MTSERDILQHINELVEQEHRLREQFRSGEVDSADEQSQLTALEQTLDQAWDLLRQRRAKREFGQDPEDAEQRPVEEVERYLQ
ncbi:DUF2630 family protein [Nakamurella endophytica]|uniref:DUF2630 family protein n=1 Tax=Nakamurella endophytica TaxID=1748367 RepID=A0A917W9A7_9ACTN|nr:DUF2630 family protein [Nakamurella endophytica]GGL85419.1 hypothetical protein GCM10011594_01340 [Nakamurella endophytica]